MKLHLPAALMFVALAAFVAAPSASADSNNASIYSITKTALYIQKDSGGAIASPKYPYDFNAQSQTAATLALPGGATMPVVFVSDNDDYEINQAFLAKTGTGGLDTAFPNGTYQMTVTGITPTLSLPLSPDSYPPAIPSVTNGTWSGGVLMINASAGGTIDISNFSTFASGGVGGYMQLKINDMFGTGSSLGKEEISVANPFGITQGSQPFTSYTVAASALNPGDIYEARLDYQTALKFDTTTVPGSGVIALFENDLVFYVVAPVPGVTTPPPIIQTDLTDQTAYFGQTATFAPSVTVGGSPISGGNYLSLWYLNGQQIDIDGVKYQTNGANLVINNAAASDEGVYFAKILNDGGVATTASVTLTVQAPGPVTVTTQPHDASVNSGSTAVFTVVASGSGSPTYQWQFSTNGGASWNNVSNGNGISGATGPQLMITDASGANAAEYEVTVTGSGSSATSAPATLQVETSSNPGLATSISTRAFVGTGDNILIGGFYIVGSTSRTVLVQAIGPGLTALGVTGALAHPDLSIHQNQSGHDVTLYSNIGWSTNTGAAEQQVLLAAAASVFASPTLVAGAADSELLLTLPPGGYSAEVSGADGGTGVALCAIYELP
jgi:hypothetical protein